MATEHVDQDKQPKQSEVSSSSGWNVTTSRMVIEFYKKNRVLWDRNHEDYGKKFNPELVLCLVAATCRSSSADEATCRSDGATCRSDGATYRRDVSPRFVASCVSALIQTALYILCTMTETGL